MNKFILIFIVLMSTISQVSAGAAVLELNPLTQEIEIETIGTYNLILNTTVAGNLYWDTENPNITARIDGEPFGQSGNITVPIGISSHILEVIPLSGITINIPYDIAIWHTQGGGIAAKAVATAGIIPVPELITIVFTSAGILGLIGIARIRRKD